MYPSDFSYDSNDAAWYSIFGRSGNLKQAITDSMEILSLKQLALETLLDALKGTDAANVGKYSKYEDQIKRATAADNKIPVPSADDLSSIDDLAQYKDDPEAWPAYEKENIMVYLGSVKKEIAKEMPASGGAASSLADDIAVDDEMIDQPSDMDAVDNVDNVGMDNGSVDSTVPVDTDTPVEE